MGFDDPVLRADAEQLGATFIVKGTTGVGSVSGSRGTAFVTSWEILDARSGRREYGISIEIRESAQAERERERERGDVAYVDYDELDPLINGLDHLLKLDNTATGQPLLPHWSYGHRLKKQ